MKSNIFSLILLFALLVTACNPFQTSNPIDIDSTIPPESEQDKTIDESAYLNDGDIESIGFPDYPLISPLESSISIAYPGEMIEISGHPALSGELTVTSQENEWVTSSFSDGAGELNLPDDIPDGIYLIKVETESGALAYTHLRVTSEPGIWLETDQKFINDSDLVELTITYRGLPEDALVIFGTGDFDWEDEFFGDFNDFDLLDEDDLWLEEFEEGEVAPTLLAPLENGLLAPTFSFETRLSDLIQTPIYLPGIAANFIQVIAIEGNGLISENFMNGYNDEDDWNDDDFYDDDYEDWDTIMIDIDYWLSETIELVQCNQISLIQGNLGQPGAVQIWSTDGALESQSAWTETGNFTFEVKPGQTLILAQADIENGSSTEVFSVQFEVPCGSEVNVDLTQGHYEIQTNNYSHNTLLSGQQNQNPPLVVSPAQTQTSLLWPESGTSTQAPVLGKPVQSSQEGGLICRQVAVGPISYQGRNLHISHLVASRLNQMLSRANVFSAESASQLASAGVPAPQVDFNISSRNTSSQPEILWLMASNNRGTDRPQSVFGEVPNRLVADRFTLETLVPQLGSRMADSAICGELIPERFELAKDESKDFMISLTNLNGAGVSDASIEEPELDCGTVKFEEVTGSGGFYLATYTATEDMCTDNLIYSAEWQDVKAENITGTARVFGNYLMIGNRQLEAVFFTMETGLLARACNTSIIGPWQGELTAQPDPGLAAMIGLAGAFSTLANLPGEGQRLMDLAPRFLEEGVIDVTFNMPEDGGHFDIFSSFIGYYYPDQWIAVIFVSAEYLFIAEIIPIPGCP